MKTLTIIFILIFNISIFGQLPSIERCKVTAENLPAIRGLKLGMSFKSLKLILDSVADDGIKEDGRRVALAKNIRNPEFSDIQEISFDLIDDSIKRMDITYKSGTNFKNAEDFRDKLSPALGIPLNSWLLFETQTGGLIQAKCYGFEIKGVFANVKDNQQIQLKIDDNDAMPTIMLRKYYLEKKVSDDKKKRTDNFKP